MKSTEDLMNEHRIIERMLDILAKACDRLEGGDFASSEAFAHAADFFKNFADLCHHGKEEKKLFQKMVARGMSAEVGPIAVMLHEHEDGRAHVRAMGKLSEKKLDDYARDELMRHSREYVDLLRQHIQKEDNILYPIADKILTEADQKELEQGFEEIETKVMGPGVHERYHKMIEAWEEKYA